MAMKSNSMNIEEQGLARRLWIKCQRESIFAKHTPFLICLASGTLNVDSFKYYIAQHVCLLKAFAQAYQLAEDCADDDDEKVAISDLRKKVLVELKMLDSFVEESGSDIDKVDTPNSATAKYTDFLLATASGKFEGVKGPVKLATPFEKTKIAAYSLSAMTPCVRLYAFLGMELRALLESEEEAHPYMKWIDNYSSECFQEFSLQTEELLDRLSVSLTGDELNIIEKLYCQGMKLKVDFFSAQTLIQPIVIPLIKDHNPAEDQLLFFSDFDLTCSAIDSSAVLAQIAIVTAPKSDQDQSEAQIARMPSADLKNTWDVLSAQYTEEHEQCIESILQTEEVKEFNLESLREALEQLSDFEKRANSRVIESGVLKGLCFDDIKRASERLKFQDGCSKFFQKIVKDENLNLNVNVLSYCWCGDMIRSAFSSGGLDVLNVHANELTFEDSISTGEILKKMESPIDKVQAFNSVIESCCDEKKSLTVYVGDSAGDLLCLLEADIGIVIGYSSSLRKIGSHFGVSFVPLFSGLVKKQRECIEGSSLNWKGRSGTLYTVSNWAEIHAFVLGW